MVCVCVYIYLCVFLSVCQCHTHSLNYQVILPFSLFFFFLFFYPSPMSLMSQLTGFFLLLFFPSATIPPPSAIVDTTWEILLADPMILIPISCTLIVAAGILLIVLFLAHRNCTSEMLFSHTNGPNGGCSNRSPSHHTSVGTFSQQALHLLSQHQPGQLGFHETQCELLFFLLFSSPLLTLASSFLASD